MGALRGNQTFSRFFVIGDLPDDVRGMALRRVRANAFRDLIAEEEDNERFGWATLADPFDTEFDHDKLVFNEFIVLCFRLDRWVIAGPLLKAQLREAEEKLREKKEVDKLSRKAKADLKAMVIRRLRKQLVPVTKATDLIWDLTTNVVYFYSHSQKTHEMVQALFEKTFKLQLLLETPGTATHRLELSDGEQAMFERLEPTTLGEASNKPTDLFGGLL